VSICSPGWSPICDPPVSAFRVLESWVCTWVFFLYSFFWSFLCLINYLVLNSLSFFVFFFPPVHARKVLYHWDTSPAIL
jgi:hypothetical protein